MDRNNVSAGKPKVTGAVFDAPLNTSLPTDATTALASAFKELGYVSEDGVGNTNSPEKTTIKAWGGAVVLEPSSGRNDTFKLKLIEAKKQEVLELVYGEDNVDVSTETATLGNITVDATNDELPHKVFVIDMALSDEQFKRIVIPDGQVKEIGEIKYSDKEPIGYELTITAFYNATAGCTHREFISA